MIVLVTCKNEEDPIKNEGARVLTTFLPFLFSGTANSAFLGQIRLKYELVRVIIVVLVTCKYEEDRIKNEGAKVFTTFLP